MPTTEKIRERLARFMGWDKFDDNDYRDKDDNLCSSVYEWHPDQDRNQIAMVEERLTEEQWRKYASTVFEKLEDAEVLLKTNSLRYFRTAPPLQCAQALYEVIGE